MHLLPYEIQDFLKLITQIWAALICRNLWVGFSLVDDVIDHVSNEKHAVEAVLVLDYVAQILLEYGQDFLNKAK